MGVCKAAVWQRCIGWAGGRLCAVCVCAALLHAAAGAALLDASCLFDCANALSAVRACTRVCVSGSLWAGCRAWPRGRVFWGRCSSSPWRDQRGAVAGWRCAARSCRRCPMRSNTHEQSLAGAWFAMRVPIVSHGQSLVFPSSPPCISRAGGGGGCACNGRPFGRPQRQFPCARARCGAFRVFAVSGAL